MSDDIPHRLDTVWAPWARRGDGTPLDYPSETPLGRVMREGPSAGQSTARDGIPPHPEAEALERAIIGLGDPQLVRLVKLRHVDRWRVKEIAKKFRKSRQTVYTWLGQCYRRIGSAIGGE